MQSSVLSVDKSCNASVPVVNCDTGLSVINSHDLSWFRSIHYLVINLLCKSQQLLIYICRNLEPIRECSYEGLYYKNKLN